MHIGASVMSKELKEKVISKANAAVEGVVRKAHAAVEEIALQVVQDEVESPSMLGIDNARFLYEVGKLFDCHFHFINLTRPN